MPASFTPEAMNWLDWSAYWPPPISNRETPDPWMMLFDSHYYLTFTASNHIEIWRSDVKQDWTEALSSVVWRPAPGSPWSDAIWAPELHYLNGRWYIYAAAAQPGKGNASHRTILLRCSGQDPMRKGSWEFLGPLKGLPDHWHIDATVFSPSSGELYCCYSGWPLGDFSDTEQVLFLIKMQDPEQAIRETLTVISKPELVWERPDGGKRGINEGMAWVDEHFFRGLVFSADGSWTCNYKLGLLRLVGKDILNPASWKKRPTPLLISKAHHDGPFGPGHASFMAAGGDTIDCVFHATDRPTDGWANRRARVINLTAGQFKPDARPICCPGNHRSSDGEEYADALMVQHRLCNSEPHKDGKDAQTANGKDFMKKPHNQTFAEKTLAGRQKKGFLKRLCC